MLHVCSQLSGNGGTQGCTEGPGAATEEPRAATEGPGAATKGPRTDITLF